MDQHAALAAGADRHVPADEEGQPAEHLLLGQFRVRADQVPDTSGEILVIGHAAIVPSRAWRTIRRTPLPVTAGAASQGTCRGLRRRGNRGIRAGERLAGPALAGPVNSGAALYLSAASCRSPPSVRLPEGRQGSPQPHRTAVILSRFWISPGHEGFLRLRHVADVRFWARLRTQKRSDKGSTQVTWVTSLPVRRRHHLR